MVNFLQNALIGILAIFPNVVFAVPTAVPETPELSIGIHRELDISGLPVLTLPYASYKASTYNKSDDVCIILLSLLELQSLIMRKIVLRLPEHPLRRTPNRQPPLAPSRYPSRTKGYTGR